VQFSVFVSWSVAFLPPLPWCRCSAVIDRSTYGRDERKGVCVCVCGVGRGAGCPRCNYSKDTLHCPSSLTACVSGWLAGWMDGWSVMSPTHGHTPTGPLLHPLTTEPHYRTIHGFFLGLILSFVRTGAGRDESGRHSVAVIFAHTCYARIDSPAAHGHPHPVLSSITRSRLSRLISSLVSSPCLALPCFGLVGWSACVLIGSALAHSLSGSCGWMDGWT